MKTTIKTILSAAALSLTFSSTNLLADASSVYKVTITNITHAINFTPILVSSQKKPIHFFQLGDTATADLSAVAEGGNTAPLAATLEANETVVDVQSSGGLLSPGASVSVEVSAKKGAKFISIASMMLPTNDGFIALNSVKAPKQKNKTTTYFSPAYDAGTETNDELCVSIPGPTCGGEPFSPNDDGEGFVHIHRGIQNIGDLAAHTYDWNNPVAKISITRMK